MCESADFDQDELVAHVERTVIENCEHHDLIMPGEKVVVGLSGGVDSSSLLLALLEVAKSIPFELIAVTFEDFDSQTSPTYSNAKALTAECGVNHHIAPARLGQEIFKMRIPINEALVSLMDTDDAQYRDVH